MLVFLATLAFLGWTFFAVAVCIIAAGASRGLKESEQRVSKKLGGSHV